MWTHSGDTGCTKTVQDQYINSQAWSNDIHKIPPLSDKGLTTKIVNHWEHSQLYLRIESHGRGIGTHLKICGQLKLDSVG